jgi:hypothetical protein
MIDDEAGGLVRARVARIRRHTDYNFKPKEPILWTPPKQAGFSTVRNKDGHLMNTGRGKTTSK